MSHVRIAAAVCIAVALAGGILLGQGKPDMKPLRLPVTIETPGMQPDVVSLQTEGAWSLTIRAGTLARKILGIGAYEYPYQFPLDSQQAFIVFENPDKCFSLAQGGDTACGATDEVYLEFTPTINTVNLRQNKVDAVDPKRLGPRPTLLGWTPPLSGDLRPENPGSNTTDYEVGPDVGANLDDSAACIYPTDPKGTCDNYGYGASPNMPGLVIVSDRGVGIVWADPDSLYLGGPRVARNLAGLINSVTWTLNACDGPSGCGTGSTVVTAQMNVPARLFRPLVRLDRGYGDIGGRWYQVDGGDWVPDPSRQLVNVLNQLVTTVRVFVVSGRAPDVLEDLNSDGVVDWNDAVAAGLTVLSNEQLLRFKMYYQSLEGSNADLAIQYDYDGNGMQGIDLPAGGGGVTPIPR
jgi:hypothetical protein